LTSASGRNLQSRSCEICRSRSECDGIVAASAGRLPPRPRQSSGTRRRGGGGGGGRGRWKSGGIGGGGGDGDGGGRAHASIFFSGSLARCVLWGRIFFFLPLLAGLSRYLFRLWLSGWVIWSSS
jgi:hypothetical protein